MAIPKHIVQRQVVELQIDNRLNHKMVQDAVTNLCYEVIIPLLDEVLTAQSEASTIRLPRLEINLGKISFGKIEQEFAEKFVHALQEALGNVMPSSGLALEQFALPKINNINNQHPEKPNLSTVRAAGALELVLHFLHTGLFPWWAQETTLSYLAAQLKELTAQSADGPIQIIRLLAQSGPALQRMVNTFEDTRLIALVEAFAGEAVASTFLQRLQALPTFFAGKLPKQTTRKYYWKAFIASAALIQPDGSNQPLKEQELLFETSKHFIKQIVETPGLLAWLQKEMLVTDAFTKELIFLIQEEIPKAKAIFSENENSNQIRKLDSTIPESATEGLKQRVDVEKVYIQNAGLVLLWPFLHRFFQQLQLVNEDGFTSMAVAERACLLLQFAVTGSVEEMLEAQLPLNKLLCGVPLLHPLFTRWVITPEEVEEVDYFLQAVIQNGGEVWKNLSVNGLRQAYLNRPGILSSRDGSWLLQVERKPYDILIERLPWNVSIIKFPWMERLIFVEW